MWYPTSIKRSIVKSTLKALISAIIAVSIAYGHCNVMLHSVSVVLILKILSRDLVVYLTLWGFNNTYFASIIIIADLLLKVYILWSVAYLKPALSFMHLRHMLWCSTEIFEVCIDISPVPHSITMRTTFRYPSCIGPTPAPWCYCLTCNTLKYWELTLSAVFLG